MYRGDYQAHPFKSLFVLYVEKVASARNSMNGEHFDGLPRRPGAVCRRNARRVERLVPVASDNPQEIFGGHSRTMPADAWLGELLNENAVLMNRRDAEARNLADGDLMRTSSSTIPDGQFYLGNGETKRVEGRLKIIEGIRPGVVAISWHFGH